MFLWCTLSISVMLLVFLKQLVEYILFAIANNSFIFPQIWIATSCLAHVCACGLFIDTDLIFYPICHNVFSIKKSKDKLTPTDLTTTLIIIFLSFGTVFFYCELGETVTQYFNIFHEHLCQSNWYKFPIDVQRMLIIFMLDTQQPAAITGYGNIECTRDSFKNVNVIRKKIEFDLDHLSNWFDLSLYFPS